MNPGYSSTINRTAVDEEIRRLKEVTGTDYAPDFAKKTVTVSENGVSRNVKLDEDQYNQYRTMLGITDYSLRDALINDKAYGQLPDSILGKAMSKAKEYANAVAKQSLDIGYTPEKWITDLKDASLEDVVKAILSSAIDSVGGIADTAKMQEYSTAYSGSKYGNVSGDIIQMAKEKAEAFENLSAKEALGFTVDKSGYDDLSAMSSAERADYFVQKAIESANNSNGYLPDNQKAGYDVAVKALNGAQFTGISDNVKESAIKAANSYYKALALSDYGAKLSEDNQKLDGLSTDDLAKHFFDKAVGDMYKDTNNNGEKWDEIQTAYNNKEINDAVVFATLPDKAADAYMKWGKEAGVTASQWLDALSYHNSAAGKDEINEDGKTTKSAEDKMREYVDSQDGLTQVQKDAIYRGFYSDGTANYKWLSKSLSEGTITADEAKKQLTPTYQTGWSQNVKSTGVSMKDYIDAVVLYEDAPSEEERKTMGYKEKWTWYVNELNKTDMTAEQKYAIVVSMNDYAESTKKKIKAKLK